MNEWVQAVSPYVIGIVAPAVAWMFTRSVRMGERVSKLEGENDNVSSGLSLLRTEVRDRMSELREDIKALAARMDR